MVSLVYAEDSYEKKNGIDFLERVAKCHDRLATYYRSSNDTWMTPKYFIQCDEGYRNETFCVDMEAVGNKSEECLDGFDESKIALKIKRLVYSFAENENISHVIHRNDCSIAYPEDICECEHGDYISCSGKYFRPADLKLIKPGQEVTSLFLDITYWSNFSIDMIEDFKKLQILRIVNGNIETLHTLKFEKLMNLVLRNDKIRFIVEGAFRDLSNLEFIHMGENLLTNFSGFKGHNLPNLQRLNISYNNFGSEGKLILPKALKSVVELDLSFCNLKVLNDDSFMQMTSLGDLNLAGNNFEVIYLPHFQTMHLETLYLNNNQLKRIIGDEEAVFQNLGRLDLSFNKLEKLPYLLQQAPKLKFLHLSNNILKSVNLSNLANLEVLSIDYNYIEGIIFPKNSSLRKLDLSFNPLTTFDLTQLRQLDSLWILFIDGKPLSTSELRLLGSLNTLRKLRVMHFKYCRYAPQVHTCLPLSGPEGVSSFYNLIDSYFLRVSVWLIALVCIIGNALVIISSFLQRGKRKSEALNPIVHLAGADLCMGVYLLILGIQDTRYRNKFNRVALHWNESKLCKFTGFLAVVSCLLTVCMLCFMALERLFVISNPLRRSTMSKTRIRITCLALWIVCLLLACVPFFTDNFLEDFYGSSDVCFPLFLSSPYAPGWQYSLFILVCITTAAIILLAVSYSFILLFITRARKEAGAAMNREKTLVIRLLLIVVSDAVCWMPVIVLKLLVMANPHSFTISSVVHAWIAIIVLPINGAVNPWLYTFTTTDFRKKFNNLLKGRPLLNQTRTSFMQHSVDGSQRGISLAQLKRKQFAQNRYKSSQETSQRESMLSQRSIHSTNKRLCVNSKYGRTNNGLESVAENEASTKML